MESVGIISRFSDGSGGYEVSWERGNVSSIITGQSIGLNLVNEIGDVSQMTFLYLKDGRSFRVTTIALGQLRVRCEVGDEFVPVLNG